MMLLQTVSHGGRDWRGRGGSRVQYISSHYFEPEGLEGGGRDWRGEGAREAER